MTVSSKENISNAGTKEFLTMLVAGQLFGVPVLQVQDVLGERKVTKVPLAPKEVAGAMNLRGRIVTAISLRQKLRLPEATGGAKTMYIVVEYQNELYSLIVDSVGDVLSLPDKDFEKTPATIDPYWRDLALGIYRLKGQLLVILDVPSMLDALCVKEGNAA